MDGRKTLVSGTVGLLLAAALLLTGAPTWLFWVGIAAGVVVMAAYYLPEALEKERKRRTGR